MSPQYDELRPTSGWVRSGSLRHPCKFQQVSRLGSITARHLVVGVRQTLRHWTESATYIQQGDHHVGHWPTFLVDAKFLCGWTAVVMWAGISYSILSATNWWGMGWSTLLTHFDKLAFSHTHLIHILKRKNWNLCESMMGSALYYIINGPHLSGNHGKLQARK